MKLKKLKLDQIKPYPNNPRRNDAAVQAVAESIKQCSYITPIILDEDRVIIAGHTRYKAMMSLGMTEAECLIAEGLSEEQKKKYRFLDNKTGEKATWDLLKLETELDGLNLEGFTYFPTGDEVQMTPETIARITESKEISLEAFTDEQFRHTCPKCGYKFN